MTFRAGVVTVSDKGFAGEREDLSGPLLVKLLQGIGAEAVVHAIVPDEPEQIEETLIHYADDEAVDVVVTTGGTGLTPRDRTPEATLAVIDREVPGLAEVLRFEGHRKTPLAVISRGVAGIRGHTLIVNLPGSPRAVREGMETLTPILPHAIRMARGEDTEHREEEIHA
ncbi:MAG: MogA/MoaB family molybdenum cofactor biosynthesis protein [Anaerolineae bacterium]|jgi:molybdenum cofactor synthesis domain-containing protein